MSQQIEGSYTGRHRSSQQGGAGEFADYREYVEGEDLRRLDWKVLGRTGRIPHGCPATIISSHQRQL